MRHKWVIYISILAVVGAAVLICSMYDDPRDEAELTSSQETRDGLARRMKLGDMRLDAGDVRGALEAHREGLELAGQGAARDPTNPTWKHDQAILHFRLSYGLKELGHRDEARKHASRCTALYESLAEIKPQWREELEQLRAYLDDLTGPDD